jgi:hypothetical protein
MWRINVYTPKGLRTAERGVFLTYLKAMNMKNISVYTPKGLRTAERGEFSDLPWGHECEEYMILYSQGTEAECGILSDLSGGHECEEYVGLYSQGTEDCGGGSIFWPVWGSWMWRIYDFILPRDWGWRCNSLTFLEVMNMSLYSQGTEDCREGSISDLSGGHECEDIHMILYSQGTENCREGSIFWPVWRSGKCEEYLSLYSHGTEDWRRYDFVLPRDWGLQRGEYFLTCLELMICGEDARFTPKELRLKWSTGMP